MRLPTIDLVVESAAHTARRFPLVLVSAVVCAVAGLALTGRFDNELWQRVLLTAMLGLPLFYSLAVLAERRARSDAARFVISAAGVALLGAVWWSWTGWSSPIQILRYVQLSLAFHLLAAFLPYMDSGKSNGFWQYNKVLFLRFLTAALYSGVLYVGLVIALVALKKLLAVPVPNESYMQLWILISYLFNTWFFLGGIPEDFEALETRTDYPGGLRIFTQYVLIPIVAIYLLILTAYLAKVVGTRHWPNGWIGYLVSSVTAVGILSWLLIYPLEEREEYAWVKAFTKGFYIVLAPSIAMLWLAIWKRVHEYGITEKRYFLIVLTAWLTGIAVYYTFSRKRSIKLIPSSLCALALLTFAGPQGAYAVSRVSQTSRLGAILARNDLLAEGRLHRTAREVSVDDRREIGGALTYLVETHGRDAVASWLTDSLKNAFGIGRLHDNRRANGDSVARAVMASIGLEFVLPGTSVGAGEYINYYTTPQTSIAIDGYNYAVRLNYWAVRDSVKIDEGLYVRMSTDSTSLRVTRNSVVVLEIPVRAAFDSAAAFRNNHPTGMIPAISMRAEARNGDVTGLVYFGQLAGTQRLGQTRITSFDGELFLRIR